MKFHIDEIFHLAQSNTKYIKKLGINKDRTVNIRFAYVPITMGLKYKNFNDGIMIFEIAGNKIKRGLVRTSIGIILKKTRGSLSRVLSVSGNMVFLRINDFLNKEIPGVKGMQLNGFDIIGKEIIVLIDK